MNQLFAKFMIVTIVCSGSAKAQLAPWPQVSQLDSPDVYFACNVSDVTFVYLRSSFTLRADEKRNFRALGEKEILRASTPNDALDKLFAYAAGYEVDYTHDADPPSLERERVEEIPFRIWHVVWSLFPSGPGGFSGEPFRYHSFVRPDGKRFIPEIYFCDFLDFGNQRYFSSLPFKEIERSIDEDCINAEAALRAAQDSIRQLSVELAENCKLRQVLLKELPFANDAWGKEAFVYEVEFSNVNVSDAREDRNPFSIWVATNGKCSTISVDRWTIAK